MSKLAACARATLRWSSLIDLATAVVIGAAGYDAILSARGAATTAALDAGLSGVLLIAAAVAVAALSLVDCAPVSRWCLILTRYFGRSVSYLFFGVVIGAPASQTRVIAGSLVAAVGVLWALVACFGGSARPVPLTGLVLCVRAADGGGAPAASAPAGAPTAERPRPPAAAGAPSGGAKAPPPPPGATYSTSRHGGAGGDNPFHEQKLSSFDAV